MPKVRFPYGKSVVDGRVRFLSPSSIEKADANSHNGGGCLKSYYAHKVLGWKPPIKINKKTGLPVVEGKDIGNDCHDQIDHFLNTGERSLGPIASAALPYMPLPQCLGVEVELSLGGAADDLSESIMVIEGIPLVMYLDIVDRRGQYLNEEANGFFPDPHGTIEYLDWKFGGAKIGSKNPKCYAKTGGQLANDTQMVIGGLAIGAKYNAEHIRLSHVYTNTKGVSVSSKASILTTMDALESRGEYIAGVVRTIKDIVQETEWEKVPGNVYACGAYGGCPWKDKCSTWKQEGGLAAFYGTSEIETLTGDQSMSLLAGINLPGMVTQTPNSVTATLGFMPPPQPSTHDVLAQMAQITPIFTPAFPTAEFNTAITQIEHKGYGLFALSGRAAQMYLAFRGDRRPITADSAVLGYGTLGGTGRVVEDPAVVLGAWQELQAHPVNPKGAEQRPAEHLVLSAPIAAPAVLGILSPTSPPSNPSLAADPVPGFNTVTPQVAVPGLIASVPPGVAAAVLAQHAAPAGPSLPPAPPEKVKRKYARKNTLPTDGSQDTATDQRPLRGDGDVDGADGAWLFVNCRSNINLIDLQPLVDQWCLMLAKHHQINPPDIRAADRDSKLGYGAWKGHVTAIARFEANKLEPGGYYLNTRNSEINQCVLEGLRSAKRLTAHNGATVEGDLIFEMVNTGE